MAIVRHFKTFTAARNNLRAVLDAPSRLVELSDDDQLRTWFLARPEAEGAAIGLLSHA